MPGRFRVGLIIAEGNIHTTSARSGSHHALSMVDHLIQCDRQGSGVPCHDIAGAVAHQNDVNAGPRQKIRAKEKS